MCFSSWNWRTDLCNYSMNYLHQGEPKTSYGIPGACAEKFEAIFAMFKVHIYFLYHTSNSSCHIKSFSFKIDKQLVSPHQVMKKEFKIFSILQEPGDFVITLPKVYKTVFSFLDGMAFHFFLKSACVPAAKPYAFFRL